MAIQIITGKKYHILTDLANKVWSVISFWTKASDVEFNDGKTAETKLGAITGITSDLAGESETVAASIKAVNKLNNNLSDIKQKWFFNYRLIEIEAIISSNLSTNISYPEGCTETNMLFVSASVFYNNNYYSFMRDNEINFRTNHIEIVNRQEVYKNKPITILAFVK